MSDPLSKLQVGDLVDLRGPQGKLIWHKDGACTLDGTSRHTRELALICGGSGITPIIQVIRGVLQDETDKTTKMWLIDANRFVFLPHQTRRADAEYFSIPYFVSRTRKDILLFKELNDLANEFPDRLKTFHILSNADENWTGARGRVEGEHLIAHLPTAKIDTMAFYCGPVSLYPALNFSTQFLTRVCSFRLKTGWIVC